MHEVALADEGQVVARRQRGERFGHAIQQFDRVRHHLLAPLDQLADLASTHAAVGHLDGRLDHREGEALHAVAEVGQVAPLGGG